MGRTYSAIAETKKDAREKCAEKCFPDILEVQMKAQKRRPKQLEPTGRPMAYEHMEDEVGICRIINCLNSIHVVFLSGPLRVPVQPGHPQAVHRLAGGGIRHPGSPPGVLRRRSSPPLRVKTADKSLISVLFCLLLLLISAPPPALPTLRPPNPQGQSQLQVRRLPRRAGGNTAGASRKIA